MIPGLVQILLFQGLGEGLALRRRLDLLQCLTQREGRDAGADRGTDEEGEPPADLRIDHRGIDVHDVHAMGVAVLVHQVDDRAVGKRGHRAEALGNPVELDEGGCRG